MSQQQPHISTCDAAVDYLLVYPLNVLENQDPNPNLFSRFESLPEAAVQEQM